MAPVREIGIEEALRAGRALFGAAFAEPVLLDGAWRAELRGAFRRRALETHPDRARALGRPEEALAREFQRVREAYRLLSALVLPGTTVGSRNGTSSPRTSTHGTAPSARPATWTSPRAGDDVSRREIPVRPGGRAAQRPRGVEGAETVAPRVPRGRETAPGSLPPRRLRLGELLYHSGRVSFADMAAAVGAQRAARPAIGRAAVELGFLSAEQVRDLLARRRAEGARRTPFATYAVRAGALTPFERLAALGRQAKAQRRIGAWLVERGVLSEAELAAAIAALARHNARYAR